MNGTQYLRRAPKRRPTQQPYSVLKWSTSTSTNRSTRGSSPRGGR